jgi:predicted secreted Zn-dependent protease
MRFLQFVGLSIAMFAVLRPSFAIAGSSPARAEVSCHLQVNERYQTYDIDGTSCDQLRCQMRDHGTKWGDGETYAAETTWDIHYNYDVAFDNGTCSVKSVKTDVDIVYHLPHRVAFNGDADLASRWNDYLHHLKRHEFGHKQLAVKTAEEINEVLSTLGSFDSQSALEREASRRTGELFTKMAAAQVRYDDETRHGESQGAILSSR